MFFAMMLTVLAAFGSPSAAQAAGSASIDQAVTKMKERVMQNDSDGDGRLSRGEFDAMSAKQGGRGVAMFDRADADKDGFLSSAEIDRILAARAKRLDRNGDGRITQDEASAARQRASDDSN